MCLTRSLVAEQFATSENVGIISTLLCSNHRRVWNAVKWDVFREVFCRWDSRVRLKESSRRGLWPINPGRDPSERDAARSTHLVEAKLWKEGCSQRGGRITRFQRVVITVQTYLQYIGQVIHTLPLLSSAQFKQRLLSLCTFSHYSSERWSQISFKDRFYKFLG